MKKLLTYILCILTTPVIAQPILNNLYDYKPGDIYTYRRWTGGYLDTAKIPSRGANITWDFRHLIFDVQEHTDSVISLEASAHPIDFAGCNFVYREYKGLQQYYANVNGAILYRGNNYEGHANIINPFTPTVMLPATYAPEGYNNFEPIEVNLPASKGVYKGRYNAYGILKLPGGIAIPDVGLYIVYGGDENISFSDYMFAAEDSVAPLFRIQFRHTPECTTVEYAYVTANIFTDDRYREKEDIIIYPNPANEVVHIKAPEVLSAIRIYDMLKRNIRLQKTNCTDCAVKISHLSAGPYIIEAGTKEGNRFTGKFVKL